MYDETAIFIYSGNSLSQKEGHVFLNILRRMLPVIILLMLSFVAYNITQTKPTASTGKVSQGSRLLVETQVVHEDAFSIAVESFGVVQAKTNSDLYSLISGQIKTVSNGFENGSFFKEGDVLLEIDSADYEVEVQVASGSLVNAELALSEEEARYEQAQRDWSKTQDKKLASDFALRVPQLRAARANLDTAKAKLVLAKLNLERTKVKAPYDGRILDTFVNKGVVVGPSVKLAQIYSTDSIEIRLPIATKDIQFIDLPEQNKAEQNQSLLNDLPEVLISNNLIEPPQIWKGKVVRTEATIDSASQQLYVVARVDDPFLEHSRSVLHTSKSLEPLTKLRPLKIGQYVRATIIGKELTGVISIPNSTLYQGNYVYVVEDIDEGKTALMRKRVDSLWRNKQSTVIASGLENGQRLVMTLLGQVTSGTVIDEKRLENKLLYNERVGNQVNVTESGDQVESKQIVGAKR